MLIQKVRFPVLSNNREDCTRNYIRKEIMRRRK